MRHLDSKNWTGRIQESAGPFLLEKHSKKEIISFIIHSIVMWNSQIGSCLLLFFLLIFFGCTDEYVDLNFSSAKKDGQDWNADANVWYSLHFGDSSMIISLSVPSPDGISKESIGFYYVPLIEKQYSVLDTFLNDSNSIVAFYELLNSHGDVILYSLYPSESEENTLTIESYNPETKELVMSFNVLFETRHPGENPNWKHAFTEGKICTVLD